MKILEEVTTPMLKLCKIVCELSLRTRRRLQASVWDVVWPAWLVAIRMVLHPSLWRLQTNLRDALDGRIRVRVRARMRDGLLLTRC